MWMQNNHCGTIIGKGGVNIKAIREQSDCKVQVSELAPGAAERLVTTTGSIAGINKAAELMIEVLEEQAAADPAAATEGASSAASSDAPATVLRGRPAAESVPFHVDNLGT